MKAVVGSVRFRVTVAATLVTLVVLVLTGVAVVTYQDRTLTEQLEEALGERANEIASLVEARELPPTIRGPADDDSIAQVVTPGGRVLAASENISGRPVITDSLPDDYLLLSRQVNDATIVHVAAPRDDIDESVNALTASLAVALPLVTVILAGLVWWLVGRTLRPVEAIRAEVADIGGSDLHRRVPVPASSDEIARLASTMNEMLERVEDSSAKQQRFVADAAHELRTPLTRMRSELEVDLTHPGSADPTATHRSVLDETVGLQRLVDDLLHLARSDAGRAPRHDAPVDLDDIVLSAARELREEGRVTVDVSRVTAAQVSGDGDQLRRAIGNVAANAGRHAAAAVTFTLAEVDGRAELAISDDGPGIPRSEHDRVFDRFTRLDEARSAAAGGSGLGLAIAREIVEQHGGTIAIDGSHAPGARFVMGLPLARSGQPARRAASKYPEGSTLRPSDR